MSINLFKKLVILNPKRISSLKNPNRFVEFDKSVGLFALGTVYTKSGMISTTAHAFSSREAYNYLTGD